MERLVSFTSQRAHAALCLHPPALEVCNHVPPLGDLGGAVQAHVGVFSVNHVLLERGEKMKKTKQNGG